MHWKTGLTKIKYYRAVDQLKTVVLVKFHLFPNSLSYKDKGQEWFYNPNSANVENHKHDYMGEGKCKFEKQQKIY